MTGADISAIIVAVALVAAMVVIAVGVRRRGRASPAADPGQPDAVSADVVSGLMAELRKWQAESAYWKNQAERLQRALDARDGPPGS